MTARGRSLGQQLRVVLLAAIMAASSFAVTATPATRPATDTGSPFDGIVQIANQLFAPKEAIAAFCADNPGFKGYLTASASSHTALGEKTSSSQVYAYISDVNDNWSCTAYLRYDGVAWNTTDTKAASTGAC
jgi:hypothetical protein